jgi:hypothetical protein
MSITQSTRSYADYRASVVDAYQRTVTGFVETGEALLAAKAGLDHGEWLRFTEDLPFSRRTAQYLMAIAANRALSNAHHGAHLPASWRTLSQLAAIPEAQLTDLIERGQITADTTRAEATDIAQQFVAGRQQALADWSRMYDELGYVLTYWRDNTPPIDLPDEYPTWEQAADRARQVLNVIEGSTA